MFICVCIPVVLIQSNFDTPGDTSRSDTNQFSRGVQPIFRDICFSCSRAITIHQVIAIFLQFHFLSSYRNDYFCVRDTRTQPLIYVGCSVHYWVSCTTNKGGFFEITFIVVVDTHLPRFEALAYVLPHFDALTDLVIRSRRSSFKRLLN